MLRYSFLCFLACAWLHAQPARPPVGERVDLAAFGQIKGWPGGDAAKKLGAGAWTAVSEPDRKPYSNLGVEWDEPREFTEIQVGLAGKVAPEQVEPEYWVSSWPPVEGRGGWTLTDSPWNGSWKRIRATRAVNGAMLVFRIEPLSEEENENAKRQPGFRPRFRRALKVRLRFSTPAPPAVTAFRVYGTSVWSAREVLVETGLEKKPGGAPAISIYNGRVVSSVPAGRSTRIRVLYTEHEPESNDRTILTLTVAGNQFGVSIDDLIRHKAIFVRDLGVFVGDGATNQTYLGYLASGRMRLGRDIHSLVGKEPEQSLERAMAEIPPLNMTNRSPYRYVPLGFFGNREKYGLMFNGNVFISKRGSKLFRDEQARMLWQGDTIQWRIGCGATPDFRERERSARQRMLEDYLPVALTEWTHEGIRYHQEAFATLLEAPLDPFQNKGDEPSLLLVRLTASNESGAPRRATLWLGIRPEEKLRLRGGRLEATGDGSGEYPAPRFRAALEASSGKFEIAGTPPAARWEGELAPGASATFHFRVAFRTFTDEAMIERVARVDYDAARAKVIEYWRKTVNTGMRLQVPDEYLNKFWLSVLQHILLSVQRDVKTGLFLAPCGTYNYNMFANETHMQVRLLEMRGLHELAGRFLEPFVALQGSKPMPGRFRDTKPMFHGVRVDADHDYTHSGYNLNHGWTLWTLAEHYLFTRDKSWLEAKKDSMLRAARWITSERRATVEKDALGNRNWESGLLPAGQLEDNEEWLHWYAVNAYALKGLRATAGAFAEAQPELAVSLAEEATLYREDILWAVRESMGKAPVVQLKDGTWIPMVPPRVGLHGRDLGWIRNILYGAHTLVDGWVIRPQDQLATWILKDYEDNLFMAPWSFSVAEHDWFSRGGITLQPNLVNTAVSYLERDEIPHALRAFYNTFAASYYPDVNAFTEWLRSFGASGGPFYKTSDEACLLTWLRLLLVREDGSVLRLAGGAPRRWFEDGKKIEIGDAATHFGKISFRTHSKLSEGYIEASVEVPREFRGKQIVLRLRHPEKKKMVRVEIDGSVAKDFDAARETVPVPVTPGVRNIRVHY